MPVFPATIPPFHNWKKKTVLFLISQNVSLFGSGVVSYAIIWHITLETTSGLWMMLATLTFSIPSVIISLWAGVWADRYNRKRIIMAADTLVALASLAVAITFWCGLKNLELLLLAATFRSLGSGVQTPAVNAIYPQLVPAEELARVEGLNQSLTSFLMLLAPVAGGLILSLMGLETAFLADVVTAVAAVIILGLTNIPQTEPGATKSTVKEMSEGLKYVWERRPIKLLILCSAVFFFLLTPAAVLTPLMIARSFGPEVWRLTANEAAWSGAALFGGLYVAWHGDFKDKPRVLALCMAAFGLLCSLMGLAWTFVLYLSLMGLAGFFIPLYITAETVFIQQKADPAKLGRVFSIKQILGNSAMPAAILIFGPLADIVSVESILIVSGVMIIAMGSLYFKVGRP